jgi:hypothetical protein
MSLPGIDAPSKPTHCDYCGAPVQIIDPPFCAPCADRMATEQQIQSSNDYRKNAQIRLDLASVRQRVRRYLRGEK